MPVKVPIPYQPYIKTEQVITIKLKAPVENLQSTPTSLPTAEPSTSQYSKTLASTDFPTISPTPQNVSYVALVFLGGKNTDAASQTVYWRMLKNGVSIATGSASVSAGYFWTLNAFFFGVVAGDVLEVRLWASATTVNWDYDAFQVQASRLVTAEALNSPCTVNFIAFSVNPNLTKGTPAVYSSYALYPHHLDISLPSTGTPTVYDINFPKSNYGLYRINIGDYSYLNSSSLVTSSSNRPYYYRNYVPDTIKLTIWKFW